MVKGVKFLSRLLNASCSDVITVPRFFSLPPKQTPPPSSFDTHAMAARNAKLSISMLLRKNRGLWTVYDGSSRKFKDMEKPSLQDSRGRFVFIPKFSLDFFNDRHILVIKCKDSTSKNRWYGSRKTFRISCLNEWNGYLEIVNLFQAFEICTYYLFLRTVLF